MTPLIRDGALGALLVAGSWLYLRLRLRAPWRPAAPVLFDAAVMAWCAGLALALTDRPVLSGCIVAGGAAGLGLADRVKRATLREPLVFADRAELIELLRHPRLYVPFAGTGLVVSAGCAVLALCGAVVALEPGLRLALAWRVALVAGFAGVFRGCGVAALRRRLAGLFRRWDGGDPASDLASDLDGDPAAAMRRLGMLGGFVVQATLAAEGRRARQYRHLPGPRPGAGPGRPLVLVQAESFFDVRRLDLELGADRLPQFAALMESCVQHGRLAVPCWGANTVRTEFAVLTGIEPAELGLDRFNPYERFARAPVASLAWRLRGCGYQTVCVHPFDTGFYGRRRVLPQLGFDRIVGPEAFARPPSGRYVTDGEVAAVVEQVLATSGRLVFVFVITMQAHGPWAAPDARRGRARRVGPGGAALEGYLRAVAAADAGLAGFRRAAVAADGVLAVYGDHQPSLPRLGALGIDTTETDYLVWDSRGGLPRRRDLRAAQLADAVCAVAARPRLRLLQEAG
jgi:hypothetical protein